jgi:hypothetical protein
VRVQRALVGAGERVERARVAAARAIEIVD